MIARLSYYYYSTVLYVHAFLLIIDRQASQSQKPAAAAAAFLLTARTGYFMLLHSACAVRLVSRSFILSSLFYSKPPPEPLLNKGEEKKGNFPGEFFFSSDGPIKYYCIHKI